MHPGDPCDGADTSPESAPRDASNGSKNRNSQPSSPQLRQCGVDPGLRLAVFGEPSGSRGVKSRGVSKTVQRTRSPRTAHPRLAGRAPLSPRWGATRGAKTPRPVLPPARRSPAFSAADGALARRQGRTSNSAVTRTAPSILGGVAGGLRDRCPACRRGRCRSTRRVAGLRHRRAPPIVMRRRILPN